MVRCCTKFKFEILTLKNMDKNINETHEQCTIHSVSGCLCDGCNVREPWEHRCHGEKCTCDNPVCKEHQGRITHEELMEIVNRELNNR